MKFWKGIFYVLIFLTGTRLFGQDNSTGHWKELAEEKEGSIYRFFVFHDTLYAGGDFSQIGGVSAENIARWDGKKWMAMGTGANSDVYSFAEYRGQLYMGGAFDTIDGRPCNHIAKWDGKHWQQVGHGIGKYDEEGNVAVGALCVYKGELYAGGNFKGSDDPAQQVIAKWNGKIWTSAGKGVQLRGSQGGILAMLVNNRKLYVGGSNLWQGHWPPHNIQSWDGSKWDTVGNCGFDGPVFSMLNFKNDIIVSGNFILCEGGKYLSKLHNERWMSDSIKGAENGAVSLCEYKNELYAATAFKLDKDEDNNAIPYLVAKWVNGKWERVGDLRGKVTAMVVYRGKLYISALPILFGVYVPNSK